MKIHANKLRLGFSLLEMLLVLAIGSAIVLMSVGYLQQRTQNMQVDRTAQQMQQILNAALAYYVNNSKWPTDIGADLQGTYLPAAVAPATAGTIASPWAGVAYTISSTDTLFTVSLALPVMANTAEVATIIAGKLPLADVVVSGTTTVNAYINIPGDNLNRAAAVSYGGLYHHGACVPAPNCPTGMTAQVIMVPVSVSGVNDAGQTNVYPISSFNAGVSNATPTANPVACAGSDETPACPVAPATVTYWRACLSVITEKGDLAKTGSGATAWGQYVTLGAFTRCAITGEPEGSDENVYSN
jgi:prepilin-type N-terminal cleavage/methylation domain-containing protein